MSWWSFSPPKDRILEPPSIHGRTLNGIFQRGKGPILTIYLHPGMMSPSIPAPLKPELFQTTTCLHFLLRCWRLHHRRRRTGGPTRRIFLPNIVGHWANVIHRLTPKQPKRGSCSLTDEVCGEKTTAFLLEKEKHTKWFETGKKDIFFLNANLQRQ